MIMNVGFTLIYHQAVDDECWVGRTVTMTLRPGMCTATTLEHPYIEWTTMGGGKVQTIETVSIGLFGIDTVSVSNVNQNIFKYNDDLPTDYWCTSLGNCTNEELDCFFALTGSNGDVHMFESLSPKESQRIVNGIRNIAARLSMLLIAGDPAVVTEFYDTMSFSDAHFEDGGTKKDKKRELSTDEILLRLTHAFLDENPLM
jgi:hypothetical protein